jgi:nitrate reductase assembly molybdenum cofactor insertion protein NarJ
LSILKNKGILDESGTVERINVTNVNPKDAVKKELEMIRPNIQKLIQRMETMKSPYKAADSPINSDTSDETKETDSKEKDVLDMNIDSVKSI